MDEQTRAVVYINSYFAALQVSEAAQRQLEDRALNRALPEQEQAAAAAAFLDVTNELARLKAAHEAFMRAFSSTNPPSDAVVEKARLLSAALAQEIVKSNEAVAILGIITRFVTAWQQLAEQPSGPAPVPEAVASTEGAAGRIREIAMPSTTAWLLAQGAGRRN
jgi:hypothetical protein